MSTELGPSGGLPASFVERGYSEDGGASGLLLDASLVCAELAGRPADAPPSAWWHRSVWPVPRATVRALAEGTRARGGYVAALWGTADEEAAEALATAAAEAEQGAGAWLGFAKWAASAGAPRGAPTHTYVLPLEDGSFQVCLVVVGGPFADTVAVFSVGTEVRLHWSADLEGRPKALAHTHLPGGLVATPSGHTIGHTASYLWHLFYNSTLAVRAPPSSSPRKVSFEAQRAPSRAVSRAVSRVGDGAKPSIVAQPPVQELDVVFERARDAAIPTQIHTTLLAFMAEGKTPKEFVAWLLHFI